MSTRRDSASANDTVLMASTFDVEDVETALLLADSDEAEQGEASRATNASRLARVKKAINKLKTSSPKLRSRFLGRLREKLGLSPLIDEFEQKMKKSSRLQRRVPNHQKPKAEDEEPLLPKQ